MVDDFLILSFAFIEFVIVFYILSLDAIIIAVLFDVLFEYIPFEFLLFAFLDHIDCIFNDFLFLFELAWVDDDKILIEVQLADILTDAPIHRKSQH